MANITINRATQMTQPSQMKKASRYNPTDVKTHVKSAIQMYPKITYTVNRLDDDTINIDADVSCEKAVVRGEPVSEVARRWAPPVVIEVAPRPGAREAFALSRRMELIEAERIGRS